MKKWMRAIPQMLILFLFTLIGKWVVQVFHLAIPSSLIGLALLFFSLQMRWIKLSWIETGAALLLSEMVLFFIPAIVGIIKYPWLIGIKGLYVLIIVVSGTALVMISTGVTAERLLGRSEVNRRDPVNNM